MEPWHFRYQVTIEKAFQISLNIRNDKYSLYLILEQHKNLLNIGYQKLGTATKEMFVCEIKFDKAKANFIQNKKKGRLIMTF